MIQSNRKNKFLLPPISPGAIVWARIIDPIQPITMTTNQDDFFRDKPENTLRSG
jgi:hypothetical protein